MITKSGGNMFSGSLRDTYNDDNWRAYVTGNDAHPFTTTNTAAGNPIDCSTCGPNGTPSKIAMAVPQYEFTLGWPGREGSSVVLHRGPVPGSAGVPQHDRSRETSRMSLTRTENASNQADPVDHLNHRFEGTFEKEALTETNASTGGRDGPGQPVQRVEADDAVHGELQRRPVVELRRREPVFRPRSELYRRRVTVHRSHQGTILIDNQRGGTYWSPQFCGRLRSRNANSDDEFVKGTYFKSTKAGSHNMVFGYDTFDDKRLANNHESGSGYGILGTTSIISNGTIDPQWLPFSTLLVYSPIAESSLGTNFRTHSVFYNDNWRASSSVTLDLGVRWDKNHGVDSAGNLVASDSITSPRIGVVWDPKRDGTWTVTASVARYTAGLANTIADSSSAAGNPATLLWLYTGAAIKPERERGEPDEPGDGHSAGVQLVRARFERILHGSGTCRGFLPGRLDQDSERPDLTERPRVCGRHQPTAHEPRRRAGGLLVSRLPRLLLSAHRHVHRNGHRSARRQSGPGRRREHECPEAAVSGSDDLDNVSR